MKVLVIGCGLVGRGLAKSLRSKGHYVVGTTTRESRLEDISESCDEAVVLVGSDREAVHRAAEGCDAVIVCAGPSAQKAMTPEERQESYRDILVKTAENVASAPFGGQIIAISSISVYGDASNHLWLIDESSPVTADQDASPVCFLAAESTYLIHAAGRACVFRCSDIMGAGDPPIEAKVQLAHRYLAGSVPFHDEALFYRIHQRDVVRAIEHALSLRLTGLFNLTHQEVPPANAPFFDAICDSLGLPPLSFRNELKGPTRPVSVRKLLDTGFKLEHTRAESLPL